MDLTRDNILKHIDQRSIYQHYFPQMIVTGKNVYLNPLRVDNKVGSCHFNWYKNNFYLFDKATNEQIDCFEFIKRTFNCSFYEALYKINLDFNLKLLAKEDKITTKFKRSKPRKPAKIRYKPEYKSRVRFHIVKTSWSEKHLSYWSKYKIDVQTLEHFNVKPLSKYYVNYGGRSWILKYDYLKQDDPCFAYRFYKKNKLSVKIYRPEAEDQQNDKWKTDIDSSIIQGWDQLPSSGDTLIITSGLKDVMCLYKMNIPAIAPNCEHSYIKDKVIDELKQRFQNIYILFDNDSSGMLAAERSSNVYNVPFIELPYIDEPYKDVADYVYKIGLKNTEELIAMLIKESKNVPNAVGQNKQFSELKSTQLMGYSSI